MVNKNLNEKIFKNKLLDFKIKNNPKYDKFLNNEKDDIQNIRIINNRYDVIQDSETKNNDQELLKNKSFPIIKNDANANEKKKVRTKEEKEKMLQKLNKFAEKNDIKQKKVEGKLIFYMLKF